MGRTLARADIPSLGKVAKEPYSEDLKEPPGQAIVTVNRPLTLFEKEYYDPPPAYRRRPEITRMEAQTASARGYLKLPGRHPFPAAGGQRKGTSLRMSLSFGTPEGIRTSDLPLRRRSLYPAELQAHMKLWKNWRADALILYPNSPRLSTARGVFVPRFGRFFCKISCARYCSTV